MSCRRMPGGRALAPGERVAVGDPNPRRRKAEGSSAPESTRILTCRGLSTRDIVAGPWQAKMRHPGSVYRPETGLSARRAILSDWSRSNQG
jgi:hypothetical protein